MTIKPAATKVYSNFFAASLIRNRLCECCQFSFRVAGRFSGHWPLFRSLALGAQDAHQLFLARFDGVCLQGPS